MNETNLLFSSLKCIYNIKCCKFISVGFQQDSHPDKHRARKQYPSVLLQNSKCIFHLAHASNSLGIVLCIGRHLQTYILPFHFCYCLTIVLCKLNYQDIYTLLLHVFDSFVSGPHKFPHLDTLYFLDRAYLKSKLL